MRSDDEIRADADFCDDGTDDAASRLAADVPELLADRERYRGMLAHIEAENAQLLADKKRLTTERDLAVAHDTQPYPTAWAYEQACAAMHRREAERDEARAALADLPLIRRAICDPGQFLPRGDDYTEPITSWSARAVVAALAAAGVPEPAENSVIHPTRRAEAEAVFGARAEEVVRGIAAEFEDRFGGVPEPPQEETT